MGVSVIVLKQSDEVATRDAFIKRRRLGSDEADRHVLVAESFDDVTTSHVIVLPSSHAKDLAKFVQGERIEIRQSFSEAGPKCGPEAIRLHVFTDG